MADLKAFGRVGAKAMAYFLAFSTLALAIGLVVANLVQPGAGLNVDPATLDTAGGRDLCQPGARAERHRLPARHHPDTLVSAFTEGRSCRCCFVAILFGIALALIGEQGRRVLGAARTLTAIVFRIVHILMYAGADRRVRRDGLHHRQIWHRHARQSRRWSAPSTRPRLLFVILVLGAIARLAGFSIFG
jgi:aerobic C4-dicarboxylate transport protein